MGRLLAGSSFGTMDWLEEATAVPTVGLLDGPECRGKAEQPRKDGTLQLATGICSCSYPRARR